MSRNIYLEGTASYILIEHQYGEIFSSSKGKIGYPRLLSKNRKPYKSTNGMCILPYINKQWFSFFDIIKLPKLKEDKLLSLLKKD